MENKDNGKTFSMIDMKEWNFAKKAEGDQSDKNNGADAPSS